MSQLVLRGLAKLKPTENWGRNYLQQIEAKFEGSFDENILNKVAKYQSIQLHFVANTFSKLFGRTNNKIEEERNIQYFLMTALYDNLIDHEKITESALNEMFYYPEKVQGSNFNERVLIYMHQTLLDQVVDKTSYRHVIEDIHIAQKDSAKQFDKNISVEEIIDITKRKGGYSLLMCRHYLADPKFDAIDACWYHLGGLIQMTNDLFDIYKDTKEGIRTFANQLNNVNDIEAVYIKQMEELRKCIQSLPISKNRRIQFAISLSIIPAFGNIAIQQLKRIQHNSSSLPNFKDIPRKLLIIDMEKPVNIIRLILHTYKCGKTWM